MSNIQYSTEAQNKINNAENKLGDALKTLKSQIKESDVEIIPESNKDEDIEIEVSKERKKEPRRSEFVETDDPKIKERINDLYRQVKGADSRNQMIIEHNRLMEQKLAEYEEKVNQLEKQTKIEITNKVETELKTRLRVAREEHDLDTIEQIEDKLQGLRDEKLKSSLAPLPLKSTPNPAQKEFDQRMVHNAAYLQNLSEEKDAVGNLKRPYLYDWHPDNHKAVELFQSIPQEFAAAGKQADMKTIIEVLDERMQGKKRQAVGVLSGNDDDIPDRKTIRLTQEQLYVANRMGLTKEQYAHQLSLINS